MSLGFAYEITADCNLHCAFCYNVWKPGAFGVELSEQQSIALLDKVLTETTPTWIAYTGGEPTCCKHLPQVMRSVSQKFPHIRQGLITNGVLLDEEYLRELISAGLGYVEISLFADSPEKYTELTGGGGEFFYRVTQAITTVKLHALGLSVAIMLGSGTANAFETALDIAFATGADRVAVNRFVPTGNGLANEDAFSMSTQQLRTQLLLADARADKFGRPVTLTIPLRPCELDGLKLKHIEFGKCVCGKHKWAIDPAGNLRTCEQNAKILGNLLEQSFAELSNLPVVQDFLNWRPAEKCKSCKWTNDCNGGCRFDCYSSSA